VYDEFYEVAGETVYIPKEIKMYRTLVASSVICLLSAVVAAPSATDASYVSLIQVIANPEKFDGKRLVVLGFLDFEREADLLFASKDKYDNVILPDTLWIDPTEEMGTNKATLNLKYVRIDGIFHAGAQRRFRFAVGGMTDIRSCTPWSDPSHPGRERIDEILHSEPLPK
jgi:hypothetical protein